MTQRKALLKLKERKNTLATPQLDDGPAFPSDLTEIYSKYVEVSAGRGGMDRLSYTELHSWAQLTQTPVEPGEVELIMVIDRIVLQEMYEHYNKK